MSSHPDIILYTYDASVFGRRIDWYLTLCNLKYSRCEQPPRMPRPDMEKLGISYRRIPILSIGRDFYCDTRLIIDKLEQLFPKSALNSKDFFDRGLSSILETYTIDAGLFTRTAQLLPPDRGVIKDPLWVKDRLEFSGMSFDEQTMRKNRPMALSQMRLHFDTMEHGLFADGRNFILNTPKPSLADVHSVWPFDFALQEKLDMIDYLEPEYIGEKIFPKVWAYVDRFRKAVAEQEKQNGWEPGVISSEDLLKEVLKSEYFEKEGSVDEKDPLQLKKDQAVEVSPVDSGVTHVDRGKLVALSLREVVIESPIKAGQGNLRLHFPRHHFKVVPLGET